VKLAVAVAAAVCSAGLAGAPPPDAERARVLAAADRYLQRSPVTVTSTRAARSAGGPHDFFSEGDYWWPDPNNPSGPYVRRDGESNPGNFVEHRRALVRLSVEMPALTAAWTLTADARYAAQARRLDAVAVLQDVDVVRALDGAALLDHLGVHGAQPIEPRRGDRALDGDVLVAREGREEVVRDQHG